MSEREKLIEELERFLGHDEAVTLADDWLSGRLTKRGGDHEPPERYEICGSERVHVYPADGLETMAVWLQCGSYYHSGPGWIDANDL